MLNQADDKETKEAMKATKEKVDSFYQKNDAELQAIRDLIEVHRLWCCDMWLYRNVT